MTRNASVLLRRERTFDRNIDVVGDVNSDGVASGLHLVYPVYARADHGHWPAGV